MAETYIRAIVWHAELGRGTTESPKVHNSLLFLFRFCSFFLFIAFEWANLPSQIISINNKRTHSLTIHVREPQRHSYVWCCDVWVVIWNRSNNNIHRTTINDAAEMKKQSSSPFFQI